MEYQIIISITVSRPINQSINQYSFIRLRHDKMHANNSKQKDNRVSKKKAGLENKPKN